MRIPAKKHPSEAQKKCKLAEISPLWGFVTNGHKLYVLRDNISLARASNVEFDLEAMMEGNVYWDFVVLYLLCHQSRVEMLPEQSNPTRKRGQTEPEPEVTDVSPPSNPENCWLERWAKLADERGVQARESMRHGVEAAINALGAGFLTTKGNTELRRRMGDAQDEFDKQAYYHQLLRVVYRLILLFVAEEKKTEEGSNLLSVSSILVTRLRDLAAQRRGTSHGDLYESVKMLFVKLRDGYEPLGIPGLGSMLFSDRATPDLDDAILSNESLLDCIRHLAFTDDKESRRPVDFGNLGAEELGSVYESLLELHPIIDSDNGPYRRIANLRSRAS